MEILNHSNEQAEQLSKFVHFKGKATVKKGPIRDLKPKRSLIDQGLLSVLEEKA